MNSTPAAPIFFSKPSFRTSTSAPILPGSARRALAAFDTGYRFTCSFFPGGAPRLQSDRPEFRDAPVTARAGARRESLSAEELERLLERNLLPRFDDERAAVATPEKSFSPELIELGALLVIVGVVLAKLFVA